MMKNSLIYIIVVFLLFSCNRAKQAEYDEMASLYPAPVSIALDTVEGYLFNSATGDSIQPIVNSLGISLKTGVPVLAKGKEVKMVRYYYDTVPVMQPKIFQAGKPTVVSAYQNEYKKQKARNVVAINKDSLVTFSLPENPKGSVFINSTGDTVLTGVPIPAEGVIVQCRQPKPVEALWPWMKDNAIMNIKYLDVDHGMNSSSISTILEDSKGNIWLGTNGGGVSAYNGKAFTHFTAESGLSQNYLRCMLEDSQNNIWFGTGYGLNRYDGENFILFTESEGLTSNAITDILEDSKGNIWFSTDGGGASMYDGNMFMHFTTNEGLYINNVNRLLEDSKGNIWFITWGAGVSKYDGEKFTHFDIKDGLCSSFFVAAAEDKHGNLWFGSPDGVSMYDGESFTYYSEEEGLNSKYVVSIKKDNEDNLWFGTNGGGVTRYDGVTFTHFTMEEGLSSNYIRSIFEDSFGNMWIGTDGGGVSIIGNKEIVHFSEKEGLSHNVVFSLIEDSKGNLWFGTRGGGVNLFDGKSFAHYTKKEGLNNDYVLSIYEGNNGSIWFGTYGYGVCRYDGKSFKHFNQENGLCDYTVNCILEDSKGNMWFGTYNGGVSKYNGNSFTTFSAEQGLAGNFIHSLMEDSKGNIWIGTSGGVSMYSEEILPDGQGSFTHFTEKEGLIRNSVTAMCEDSNGNIWFGTTYGVSLFNGETFTYFTEKEGLINNTVKAIQEDESGNIWISTISGLSCIVPDSDPDSGKQSSTSFSEPLILSYSKKDGLKGIYFYHNTVLDNKNRIWMGSSKNLTMLNLNSFEIPDKAPAIQLDRIEIKNQFTDFRIIEDSAGVKMKFDDVADFYNYPINAEFAFKLNHLTFYFSAIDWSAPHKILYSYKIEGVDKIWSSPSAEAKADYRNLTYGKHTFLVRAIGEAQIWSEPFEYVFTIRPPWYHTWLARIAYGISALLLVLLFVRWRTAKLKYRQKELETEVDHATEEIRAQKGEVENQRDEIEAQRDELQSQRDLVMVQKKEITDSINYAKRIQTAILPTREYMDEVMPEYFVLFKPRDIVSGDFYWIKVVKNFLIVVAADCTGHGVPGAIMSMLGISLLNEQVGRSRFDKPGEILNRLRNKVKVTLAQDGRIYEQKDGMDMTLIIINNDTKELQFAGAFNPLYLIRQKSQIDDDPLKQYASLSNKEYQFYELKGDRQPISIHSKEWDFTTHQIQMEEGDSIYMLSDGYADQIGGPNGKKFLIRNLKKSLLNIQHLSMDEQHNSLDKTLEDWRKGLEQVDDILLMGIKI